MVTIWAQLPAFSGTLRQNLKRHKDVQPSWFYEFWLGFSGRIFWTCQLIPNFRKAFDYHEKISVFPAIEVKNLVQPGFFFARLFTPPPIHCAAPKKVTKFKPSKFTKWFQSSTENIFFLNLNFIKHTACAKGKSILNEHLPEVKKSILLN